MTRIDEQPLTPVQYIKDERLGFAVWAKRDDLWRGRAPVRGGKARTAEAICERAVARGIGDLCLAIDRNSSVPGMLSRACKYHNLGLQIWIPQAREALPSPFLEAVANGAELHQVSPGYMSVRRKRMREYIRTTSGCQEIGLGLAWEDCGRAETARQTDNVMTLFAENEINRIVVPVGSGGMLRGIIQGIGQSDCPILGVCVGTPPDLEGDSACSNVTLVQAEEGFHRKASAWLGREEVKLWLDPVYEAKCYPYLREGDLLWIVGHRDTQ